MNEITYYTAKGEDANGELVAARINNTVVVYEYEEGAKPHAAQLVPQLCRAVLREHLVDNASALSDTFNHAINDVLAYTSPKDNLAFVDKGKVPSLVAFYEMLKE